VRNVRSGAESRPVTDHEGWEERHRERAEEVFEPAREIAAERGVEIETAMGHGTPAKTIVEYADEHDVDAIVMGTRGGRAHGGCSSATSPRRSSGAPPPGDGRPVGRPSVAAQPGARAAGAPNRYVRASPRPRMELSPVLAPVAIVGGLLLFLVTVTGIGPLDGLAVEGLLGTTARLVGHVLSALAAGTLVAFGVHSP